MPYNETFEKLKAAQNPAFAEEIEAVKDNQTFFIGAYEPSPEGNIPKGDFNEIFQALLNNDKALKKLAEAIQARTITAGKGLQGGGALSEDVTLNVVSGNDAIIVNDNNIQLNPVNDLTTGGADKALSGEMGKKLNTDKQNKTDSRLQTDSKEIVGAINESLWSIGYKDLSTVNDFNELTQSGVFRGRAETGVLNSPFSLPFNFILINYNCSGLIEQKVIAGVDDIVVRKQVGTRWYNWEKVLRTNTKEFLGNAGISSIIYIQDSGTKTQGQGYIDKSTGQVYLCLETNTDTTITNKFMSITNVELGKKVESGFWKLNPKQIGNNSTVTDLNTIYKRGFYVSTSDVNKFINVPESYIGAFELTVSSITDAISYTTQLIKDIRNNNYYVRTQTAGIGNPVSWTKWTKLLLDTDIVDNLTTADKSKVLSANMGVELNINKSDRRNRISDDVSVKSKYVKLGTIDINIGTGRNLFSCIMIGGDNFGERNSYKISLQVSGRSSTQNNVYIDAIDAINLSGISRSINGYFIAKPISSNQMEIWYRGEEYSRGFSLEAIYNNGFTINNQMSWIDDDEGTIVETGVYKIFKIKQVMHENNKLFLGNSGISSIIYIQDAGEKTAGNGYVDKTTGQLYLCKTTNSDTRVTSNFVLATNIEIAKRQHFTKTILFDKPTGHAVGAITLSDNWENYDEFIVYGSSDNVDYVGSHRFKKEDIEYSISKGQRYMIYGQASAYWLAKITTGSKIWASGDKWENCAIFRIIGIKYGG